MFIKSGEEFEHFVAEVFEENGHHAEVTKASGDFGVDLILNGEIAVQVKFYGTVVGPAAVQEVVAGKAIYNCSEAWVVTNSSFTEAAAALAEANGVRLIAGEELQWLAENPDRSADHRSRYEAMKLEQMLERHQQLRDAAEAKAARAEAVRLKQIADWKAKREAEIAAGGKISPGEQDRLANAGRILSLAGYSAPDSSGVSSDAQGSVHRPESALSTNSPANAAPSPPAGWYPDPMGGSALRWWDGRQWTSAARRN